MWRILNTWIYRVYYWLQQQRARWRGRRAFAAAPELRAGGDVDGAGDVLCVAWGRIGDAVLATAMLASWRAAFPTRRLVYAGRPLLRAVVEPLVDEFVPLDPEAWLGSPVARAAVVARLDRTWYLVCGDLHLFYGGVTVLGPLLEALSATHRLVYAGYHLGPGLAPWRVYPRGFTVVPSLYRAALPGAVEARRHLTNDASYYAAEVVRRARGDRRALDHFPRPALVLPSTPGTVLTDLGLRPGEFAVWQPSSDNSKKDYPLARWGELLRELGDLPIVALGRPGTGPELAVLDLPNLHDLRGQTDLGAAMACIAAARLYLGLDSGLTHLAAVLGTPSLCLTQSSNLGYFFPYPESLGFDRLRVVSHPAYRACSGCFMTCEHESILTTRRAGAKCLRELEPDLAIAVLRDLLRESASVPTGAQDLSELTASGQTGPAR